MHVEKSRPTFFFSASPSPLKVPELLASVLDNLDIEEQVYAARVCRTWSELAFDRIWHHLDSFVPLFVLVGPMSRGADGTWDFSEPIQCADWSRYAIYAPRIKIITFIDIFYGKWVSNQAFQAILDYIPPNLELPRPKSISKFTTSTTTEIPQEVSMISQSLQYLNVGQAYLFRGSSQPDCSPYIGAILKAAAMLPNPSLETLNVGCYCSNAALAEAFDACLTKHGSRISNLRAALPFHDQAWTSIFNLPNLRALNIAPLDTNALPSSEEILYKIKTMVESSSLSESLELQLPLPPSQYLYPQLIRCLLPLRSLQTLKLHVTSPLSLSEAEIRGMGASWPKMRELQLSTSCDWPGGNQQKMGPRTDLSVLPSILRHFPRLEELSLPFACKQTIVAPPAEQVPASVLKTLNVENSPTPEAEQGAVEAYLAVVLPPGATVRDRSYGRVTSFWRRVAIRLARTRELGQTVDSEDESDQPSDGEDESDQPSDGEDEPDESNDSEDDTAH
ncbi:hypothetical protein FRC01_005864 [Tulasnella sp. 417]|nr:hypothetical protein FRC01_005864 [Tulasnella sp. 417]